MKFNCIANCGVNNQDFISAAYDFAAENNCEISGDTEKTFIHGETSEKKFVDLMLILDAFKVKAKVKKFLN